MLLALTRLNSTKEGTFGVLSIDGIPICLTLENPWIGNTPNESSIPPRTYEAKRIVSPRFGDTFQIKNVTGRTHILFHKGNTHKDTEGCVLLGSSFGRVRGVSGITGSRVAFDKFMGVTKGVDKFLVTITGGLG